MYVEYKRGLGILIRGGLQTTVSSERGAGVGWKGYNHICMFASKSEYQSINTEGLGQSLQGQNLDVLFVWLVVLFCFVAFDF